MKKIVEAESEAKRILDEAEHEATRMKKDLPNKIASTRQQILREAAEERERILIEAEKSGAVEAERIASEARRQVEALSRIPGTRRKQAVEKAMALLLS